MIAIGEVDETEQLSSDEYERSMAARNQFLISNGYDHLPEGYEIHHIIPLCEGGSDTPDNMVLVRDDQHNEITAAHSKFYGWNKE